MTLTTSLIEEIKTLILLSREQAIRAVDQTRVLMYWNIGKRIFEEEQAGKERADYGSTVQRKYLAFEGIIFSSPVINATLSRLTFLITLS